MRREPGEEVSSVVVVMTETADRAALRAKLAQAEKMAAVGRLASGVAHEVNNLLTAIRGFTGLLVEDPSLPEAARQNLRVVLRKAQPTKQMVQNLVSFAGPASPGTGSAQVARGTHE
jgi:C4-dicarboxylate-specific signal transduction histidine kinase